MSVHHAHHTLPGYSPDQILHDGCGECEARSGYPDHGLANLDQMNFIRAWARAAEWNRHGLADISRAEVPLLRCLWAVRIQMERNGMYKEGEL